MSDRTDSGILPVLPLALLPVVASIRYFMVCDDAYISFRYARNLMRGHGLVFNVGEYVEGYTNFLWILELTAIWSLLGIPPQRASWMLSELLTVGTAALVGLLAARGLPGKRVLPAAGLAMFLWGVDRTVAVWSTGGLATRQFTFLVLLGTLLVTRPEARRSWLALGSAALGLACLTRPEGLLVGPVVLGLVGLHRWLVTRDVAPMDAVAAAAPWIGLVGGHLLWRYSYYGYWLPNTYYAKNIGHWYEAGWSWLGAATIDEALYLLVPVAVVGALVRYRQRGDLAIAVSLVWMAGQAAKLVSMGGDHFEWRMLDPWLPFLYVGVTDVAVAAWVGAASLRRWAREAARAAVVFALMVGLFLTHVFGWLHDRHAFTLESRPATFRLFVAITPRLGALASIPGMVRLAEKFDELERWNTLRSVGIRAREHQVFATWRQDAFMPATQLIGKKVIPEDAVTVEGRLGVYSFVLADVTVIDKWGLTDAVIARAPVGEGMDRQLAHARVAPPGYFEERGVNVRFEGVFDNPERALRAAPFAVTLSKGRALAFSADPDWVAESWKKGRVRTRASLGRRFHKGPRAPMPQRFDAVGRSWTVVREIAGFDRATELGSWQVEGSAMDDPVVPQGWVWQMPVDRVEGEALLNTWTPLRGDEAVGRAQIELSAEGATGVAFRVGGGSQDVGVRVFEDGELVGTFSGQRSEALRRVVAPLSGEAGSRVRIEIFDDSAGAWGHVLVDSLAFVRDGA